MNFKTTAVVAAALLSTATLTVSASAVEPQSIMFDNLIHQFDLQLAFTRHSGGLLPAMYLYADIDGDDACNEIVLASYDGTTQVAFDIDHHVLPWTGHIDNGDWNWTPIAYMGLAAAYEPDEVVLQYAPQFGLISKNRVEVASEEEIRQPECYNRAIYHDIVVPIEFDPIESGKTDGIYRYVYNFLSDTDCIKIDGEDKEVEPVIVQSQMLTHLQPIAFNNVNQPAALPAAASAKLATYHPGFTVKESTLLVEAPENDIKVYLVEYEWNDTIALVSTVVVTGDLVMTRDDYATLHFNGDLTDDGTPMHVWHVFDYGYYSIPRIEAICMSPNGPLFFARQNGDSSNINYIMEFAPPFLNIIYHDTVSDF